MIELGAKALRAIGHRLAGYAILCVIIGVIGIAGAFFYAHPVALVGVVLTIAAIAVIRHFPVHLLRVATSLW